MEYKIILEEITMKNVVVRLQEIIMNNFKNVEYGKVSLQSYVNFNKI